jgi:hypothetical protein
MNPDATFTPDILILVTTDSIALDILVVYWTTVLWYSLIYMIPYVYVICIHTVYICIRIYTHIYIITYIYILYLYMIHVGGIDSKLQLFNWDLVWTSPASRHQQRIRWPLRSQPFDRTCPSIARLGAHGREIEWQHVAASCYFTCLKKICCFLRV